VLVSRCLRDGVMPNARHDGSPWTAYDKQIPVAGLMQMRGDWEALVEFFRFRFYTSDGQGWQYQISKSCSLALSCAGGSFKYRRAAAWHRHARFAVSNRRLHHRARLAVSNIEELLLGIAGHGQISKSCCLASNRRLHRRARLGEKKRRELPGASGGFRGLAVGACSLI